MTMTNTPTRGGSSISARSVTPSLQLEKLASHLTKALAPEAGSPAKALPLLSVAENKVLINTRGPLYRMLQQKPFLDDFEPGESIGFLRDLKASFCGATARVGGRLSQG